MFEDVLQSMPISLHALAAIALISGGVILIFGRRLLRPGLVLAGLVTGAAIGLVAGSLLPYDWSIWWPIGIGSLVFAGVAIAAYRFVMAALLAVALGVAAPLGFFTYAELTGLYEGQAGSPISDEELLLPELREPLNRLDQIAKEYAQRLDEISKTGALPIGESSTDEGRESVDEPEWRERWDAIVEAIGATASDQWNDAPGEQKWITILCGAGGVVSGFVLGALVPGFAGSIATSLAGSLIIVVSGYWLGIRTGLPIENLVPDSAAKWLAVWLALAIIGLAIQFSLGTKKADKTA